LYTTGQGIKHGIQINVFRIDERRSVVLLQQSSIKMRVELKRFTLYKSGVNRMMKTPKALRPTEIF